MDLLDLEKKFDAAMARWDVAFTESKGRPSSLERELSRNAFTHYHRWQMALNEMASLAKTEEKPKSLKRRPVGHRCPEMDIFWKEYAEDGNGHADF